MLYCPFLNKKHPHYNNKLADNRQINIIIAPKASNLKMRQYSRILQCDLLTLFSVL